MRITLQAKEKITEILDTKVFAVFTHGPNKSAVEIQCLPGFECSLNTLLALSEVFGTTQINLGYEAHWGGCDSDPGGIEEDINIVIHNPTKGVE